MMTTTNSTTKGERISQQATVTDAYTACQGNVPFESPVIVLTLADGREVRWLTDDEEWLYRKGLTFQLDAFYYEATGRIRRVQINGKAAKHYRG
jgi:hypothetical protein